MARWWGAGRRAARDVARDAEIAREREIIGRALEAARHYRVGRLERWRSLEPVAGVRDDLIADVATELIQTGGQPGVLLGLQLLDPATLGDGLSLQRKDELARLLEPLCRTDADPDVIAMALGPWLGWSPLTDRRLAELVEHPSPTVRARAALLYAGQESVPARQRFSTLKALLEQDAEANVREQAAEGLQSLAREARYGGQGEALGPDHEPVSRSGRLSAPAPGRPVGGGEGHRVRGGVPDRRGAGRGLVAARTGGSERPPRVRLRPGAVRPGPARPSGHGGCRGAAPLSLSLPPPGDGDHPEVRASLVRLRESGWADRAADSDYPEKAERAQTQDDAIEAAVAVFVVNRCRLTTPIHHDRSEG